MDCTNVGGNTGVGACDLNSQRIDGFIFVPKNAAIPKDTTDLVDFLVKQINLDSKGQRYFPLFNIDQATNNSEEAQVGTFGYGRTVKQRNGNTVMRWDFGFSLCKAKTIIQFDGWNQGIFLVSSEGYLIGKNSLDKKNLVPIIPQQFDVVAADFFDIGTSDLQAVGVSVNFGDKLKLIEQAQFLKADSFDADQLQGLVDVELEIVSKGTGVVNVSVTTKCGDVNLFDTYQTELELADVWKAIDKVTGSAVTVTGVEPKPLTKSFELSLPTGTYLLSLAAVSVLTQKGIAGYESDSITVTIT
ncbi:MAG: hypothetical protein LBK94_11395 [Prevotellaceae bacterium]|jgi:hypothetical protein|nr:hypothetical protein [Prevotellaceae bacterium]